jgi:Tol biopolymer transport system component
LSPHSSGDGGSRTRLTRRATLGLALAGLVPALAGCTTPFAPSERGVYVVDRDGRDVRRIATGSPWLAWSSDSQRLALRYDDGTIRVAAADGSGLLPYSGGAFFGPGWSPSGLEIAIADPEQNVIRIQTASGALISQAPLREELPPLWTVAPPRDNIPVWSPDGTAIAFLAWDGHGVALYTISPASTNRAKLSDTRISQNRVDRYDWLGQRAAIGDIGAPAWSPTGETLAYALYPEVRGATGGIFITAPGAGAPSRVTDQPPTSGPAWAPDGRQLAYSAREGDQSALYVAPISGDTSRNLTSSLGQRALEPAWSPDGLHLAFAGEGDLFVIGAGGSARLIANTGLVNQRLLWSPDSTMIAFLGIPPQPGR